MRPTSKLLVVALSAGVLASTAGGALAYGSYGSSSLKTVSYINGDAGKNADVDPNSSCFNPDQYDMQKFSDPATGNPGDNNVHNDACFLDSNGNKVGKNIGATFQSSGTGYISACPDPDGTGPAIARLRDLNGDGRNDSCFQSSYQESAIPGTAGDDEFHVRMNNRKRDGLQRVVWCSDADADGCADEDVKQSIRIEWTGGRSTN